MFRLLAPANRQYRRSLFGPENVRRQAHKFKCAVGLGRICAYQLD